MEEGTIMFVFVKCPKPCVVIVAMFLGSVVCLNHLWDPYNPRLARIVRGTAFMAPLAKV